MERFAKVAAQLLSQTLTQSITASDLELPPDSTLGDFGYPCFKLAKEFRKAPPQVAVDLAEKIQTQDTQGLIVKAVGPYVNFLVPGEKIAQALLEDLLRGNENGSYGSLPKDSRGKWVLEYSSPNVAKPFMVGHLRSTALGSALTKIGRFRGMKVISINHLGDWGTQYGKLAVAVRLYGSTLPQNPTVNDLVQVYVKFHEAAEKDPALEDEAREAFLKLEQGDPEITALWKKCVEISIKEFERIYSRLDVKFDHIWGESYYKDMLTPLLADLKKREIMVESEGAWVVPITDANGTELAPCIMQKKDGATIYATRDIAAAVYRWDQFHFDRMSYIVGQEQKLHFKQIFGVLKKMGHEWVDRCEHIATGLYRFKDAKMSTRKGNFITLEDVVGLAQERALALMKAREGSANQTEKELQEISEAVALGAVLFHDLSNDPAKDVEFDVERVVSFEGETGPYLQYAHTRCQSILRKAGLSSAPKFDSQAAQVLREKEELALLKCLGQFPIHLERALRFSKASQLSYYLIDVTKAFGAFYRECQVLEQEPKVTAARLMLVEATRRILAQGLGFLGIPLPEKM